ncbi:GH92 family glycosyl hydrolase [Olivibacter sitiensis]|uniref:GH92 family glycosyl hydrolase n=1 Tax=Olivibacter sitiensis TaxID=376470 RepID=UPI0003F9DFA4|nr:GH92 family glycosyl hydrolase [Olivibacter sitiensis]
MNKFYFILVFAVLFKAASGYAQEKDLTQYVDPFIGTGGHGHTFPGAVVPFGMVQLSPDNGRGDWDWCSGYHYSDNKIAGFSHTHLSGTGIGDWLDISIMPLLKLRQKGERAELATFSHDNEQASPGYYGVTLDNGIHADLSASERVGYHHYEFPENSEPTVQLDLAFKQNWDTPIETHVEVLNDSTAIGYRYSTGWASLQRVYFAIVFSKPFKDVLLSGENAVISDNMYAETEGKGNGVLAQFLLTDKTIDLKVGISMTSSEQALAAINEIQTWDINEVKEVARKKWQQELQKVQVISQDEEKLKIFYTALYHTAIAPCLFSDGDGTYKNMQGDILKMANGGQRYTLYSLWDTFRALNPLFTLTQPVRYTDMLNSMLAFYDENGLLPVWDLSTAETNTMTGYHAIPVLADAVLKDWPGVDASRAYKAMLASAYQSGRGVPHYIQYGYMPQDLYGHSASVTLEYAYDDWCIAQVAKKLGDEGKYKEFIERARSYERIFDKETGFMRAKNSDSSWAQPFDPFLSEHDEKKAQYVEGNAWQHSFFVPHDVRGLAALHGGGNKLSLKMDSLFSISSELTGENVSPDVSGLIGQYAHGNEPSHHIAYMYSYIGEPWKTQEKVRLIVDSMYHTLPDGYSGNEDVGQMSAWAIWSMAGLYPVNAAIGEYVIGSPSLEEVRFQLDGGKEFVIKTSGLSARNIYVKSVKLNGKKYEKTYITHQDMMSGGVLELVMSDKANKKWGQKSENWPHSLIDSE